MKILFQQSWEMKVGWDDEEPAESIFKSWLRWYFDLSLLSAKYVPHCYYNRGTFVSTIELHGFSDASERAYSAVVYLWKEC